MHRVGCGAGDGKRLEAGRGVPWLCVSAMLQAQQQNRTWLPRAGVLPLGQWVTVRAVGTSEGTDFIQGTMLARHLPWQGFTHPQGLIYKVSRSGSFAFSKGCRNLIAL